MDEYSPPPTTHYLLTNFSKEGQGMPFEMKQRASALSTTLCLYAIGSHSFTDPTEEDVKRIGRVPRIVHFAPITEYNLMVKKYLAEAENKALPLDPILVVALQKESVYNTPESIQYSQGLTIFPAGSDKVSAVIVPKPDETPTPEDIFLNILAEEMIHAAAPQSTFLRTAQTSYPNMIVSPQDLFEIVGRWIKIDFLNGYN